MVGNIQMDLSHSGGHRVTLGYPIKSINQYLNYGNFHACSGTLQIMRPQSPRNLCGTGSTCIGCFAAGRQIGVALSKIWRRCGEIPPIHWLGRVIDIITFKVNNGSHISIMD